MQLLSRLLHEQRAKFEAELTKVRDTSAQLAARKDVQDRDARVEMLRRQIARRMLHQGLANGWAAWLELWRAKTYAMSELRRVGTRFQKPRLALAFGFWTYLCGLRRERRLDESARAAHDLLKAESIARCELEETVRKLGVRLEMAVREKHELERKLPALLAEARETSAEASKLHASELEKEREARVALLARQIARRVMYSSMARGWGAWVDMWEARRQALRWMREATNRMKRPLVYQVFRVWSFQWEWERRGELQVTERERAVRIKAAYKELREEVEGLRETAARVDEERRLRVAAERHLIQVAGSEAEQRTLRMAEEREARVELLYRQMTRRMMHRDLTLGWGAWLALWSAKTYAMTRLKEVGNRFRRPEVSRAFGLWRDRWFVKVQREEVRRLELSSRTVEAQLRHAHFENGQIEMKRAAQEEELAAMRSKMRTLSAEALEKEVQLAEASTVAQENSSLKAQLQASMEALAHAEASRGEAQEDSAVQRKANKELIERLLTEQRRAFDEEMASLKASMLSRTKEWASAAQKR